MRSDTERGNCASTNPHQPHYWSASSCPWCLGDLMFGARLHCTGITAERILEELKGFLKARIEEVQDSDDSFAHGGTVAFAITMDWINRNKGADV